MTRDKTNERVLELTSVNANDAFAVYFAEEYQNVPEQDKKVWAMATLIYCDLSRTMVACNESAVEGVNKLLWFADLVSKFNEAKRWYFEKGNPLLLEIASNRKCGSHTIQKMLKELKSKYPIGKIENFTVYRNKVGYHYDVEALDYLKSFGDREAAEFTELLRVFVDYGGAWSQMAKELIEDRIDEAK